MARIIDSLPFGTASLCLGRAGAGHTLATKIEAAAKAGYKGLEVFYEDIKLPAREAMKTSGLSFQEELINSAQTFKTLADKHNLEIFVLQPFKNYEGLLSKTRHDEKIAKVKHWFKLAKVLGTDLILVPSMMWADGATGDESKIVADLQELADLAAKESIRLCYEALSFGAYVSTWQRMVHIVAKVDRPNFGMCLDTYNILAVSWADCTSPTGMLPNADAKLEEQLELFKKIVPIEKVFFVQLADAEKLEQPMNSAHPWYNPNQKPNMSWSRVARLYPCEPELGSYMPVTRMLQCWIHEMGYRGWISMEVFNRSMMDPSASVPQAHAERGINSWNRCIEILGLNELEESANFQPSQANATSYKEIDARL